MKTAPQAINTITQTYGVCAIILLLLFLLVLCG
jgi:hypothetical protein